MKAFTSNMQAIIKQTDLEEDCYVDNTKQFLTLMLLKLGIDLGAMFLCTCKPLLSFLNMCSISIVMVDIILAVFMSATLWLDFQSSHTALCFIMAHSSAAFSAVPVPMLCLGILDYYLQDTWAGRKCIKLVRNPVLILLMWTIAGIYAHATVDSTLREQDMTMRYLICEVLESKVSTYSVVALTTLMFFVLLPYFSMIPQWVKEADHISEAREENAKTQTSDLILLASPTPENDIKYIKDDLAMSRPSMHISLMLGFGVFWMPYLTITSLCVLFDFGIPAYISVNLLWVKCINSLLAGTVFWLRSNTLGPYSSLPDNVCLWQAFWHLSTGSEAHQQLPAAVFNPSKGKRSTSFYV